MNNTLLNQCTRGLNASIVTEDNKDLWQPYIGDGLNQSSGIWMIGSCPKSWPKDVISYMCQNLSTAKTITKDNYQYLPVYTSDGTVYRNKFCAQCNGESLQDMKAYLLFIECTLSPPSNLNFQDKISFLFDYCPQENFKWALPMNAPRRYSYAMEFPCLNSHSRACKDCYDLPPRLVNFQGYLYKNIRCAECDWGSDFDKFSVKCGPTENPKRSPPLPPPFSVIFDFNPDSSLKFQKTTRTCPIEEVYDHYLDTCRSTLSLKDPPQHSTEDLYQVILWIKPYSKDILCIENNTDISKEIARNLHTEKRKIKVLNNDSCIR